MFEYNFNYGQHFLKNKEVIDSIISVAKIKNTDTILEIGPGNGVLSEEILKKNPNKLISVEIDTKLYDNLRLKFNENKNIELIKSNILDIIDKIEFNKLVANINYGISEPLFVKIIHLKNLPKSITLLIGESFFKKLEKNNDLLSILFNCMYELKFNLIVKPESFYPPPRVYSIVGNWVLKKINLIEQIYVDILKLDRKKVLNSLISNKKVCEKYTKRELKNMFKDIELCSKKPYNMSVKEINNLFYILKEKLQF